MSRVAHFSMLSPLSFQDAFTMLRHRWTTAGDILLLPIDKGAIEELIQAITKRLPRDIIKECNSAFTYVYANRLETPNPASALFSLDEYHLGSKLAINNTKF